MENTKNWLEDLKVGDKVILVTHGLGASEKIVPVHHLTKNFIVLDFGNYSEKFRRDTGREAGNDVWHRNYIEEATSERLAKITLEYKQYKVKKYIADSVNWDSVPADVINNLYELLDPFVKEDKTNA